MAIVLLFALMLGMMLMRVMLPIGAKVEGREVRQIVLTFRERVLMQRKNVYAIGAVLLLTAAGGLMSPVGELFVILATFGILTIPVRLRVMTSGLAVNNVVYRPMADFDAVEQTTRGLRFVAVSGMRNLDIPLLGAHREEALRVIHLPRAPRAASTPRATRAGARRASAAAPRGARRGR
jgi:hypothetical protein